MSRITLSNPEVQLQRDENLWGVDPFIILAIWILLMVCVIGALPFTVPLALWRKLRSGIARGWFWLTVHRDCSYCQARRHRAPLAGLFRRSLGNISHGICPACEATLRAELESAKPPERVHFFTGKPQMNAD